MSTVHVQDIPSDYSLVWIESHDESFVVRGPCVETLAKLLEIAKRNRGQVLSRSWYGVDTRVTLECAEEHIWQTTARDVLYQDAWCPTCAFDGQWKGHNPARPRRSFKQALALAEEKGVEHLGTTTNLRDATEWCCSAGHTWTEPARAILIRGFFCQHCHGRPAKMLKLCQDTARERGGRCLSDTYINNHTPLEWECRLLHRWYAPWKRVGTSSSWCPQCPRGSRRITAFDEC
jgi:hypothetical protein